MLLFCVITESEMSAHLGTFCVKEALQWERVMSLGSITFIYFQVKWIKESTCQTCQLDFFLLLGCKRERTVSDFYVKVSLIGSQNVEHSIIWKKEHKVKVIEDTYKVRALIESKGNLQRNMKMGY